MGKFYFWGLQNHCRWWLKPWSWKTLAPWKKSYDQPRQHIKNQRHYFINKGPSSESYGFSSSYMWMRRRQWQPTPVLLPGKSHGRRSLVGCSPWVTKSWAHLSDFTFTFHFHALEKEVATHSSILAWRIPGTEEPGGLPSMGSHRAGHDWSSSSSSMYGCESWTIKKAEHRRIDAFEL